MLNEEGIVEAMVERLSAALASVDPDWGIVFVDDGSTDATWRLMSEAAARNPRVRALRLSRNFGQHTAITAGLEATDADWVVVLDGDLQDRPEVIPDLHAKASEGFDVVFVERTDRPEGRLYKLAQRLFYGGLRALSGTTYNPAHGNFSILSRRVVEAYASLEEGTRFYGGLVAWLGFRHASLPARHGERHAGAPSYNLMRRVRLAQDIILSFSTRPLLIAVLLGFACTAFSFLYGAWIVGRALLGGVPVEGWASLIVSIYFVGGMLMTMLGLNSLYMGRVHRELQRRPLYVVSERAGAAE